MAGAAVAIGGALVLAAVTADDDEPDDDNIAPRGRLSCPGSPAPTAGLGAGDYVIVVLMDRARKFEEMAWGQVLSREPGGQKFLVRLLGATGETGAVELAKHKHGFRIGTEIKVEADCVWDTMHAPDVGGKGQLYCGFEGESLIGDPPVGVELAKGDQVLVVASTVIGSDAHADPLWVTVDGVSRTGIVVRGTIASPIQYPIHGFRQWMEIEFTRDCIFDWRRP